MNTWDNQGKGKESIDANNQHNTRGGEGRGTGPSDKNATNLPNYSKEIADTLNSKK